jgi:hypothetical protein
MIICLFLELSLVITQSLDSGQLILVCLFETFALLDVSLELCILLVEEFCDRLHLSSSIFDLAVDLIAQSNSL